MKEKINKILWDFAQGKLTHDEATQQVLDLFAVVGQSEQLVCEVCGSTDVIEAPHMGRNCNRCHPL